MVEGDYNCDRPAKNDFTASTIQHLQSIGRNKPVKFYEEDINRNLVDYGSETAYSGSPIDIYMFYGKSKYAIELKERTGYTSDDYWIMTEGTYYNEEKDTDLRERQQEGYIPVFGDIYNNDIIRLWNMTNISIEDLPVKKANIKKKNVIQNSPKIPQTRRLLAVSAMTAEYRRTRHDKS